MCALTQLIKMIRLRYNTYRHRAKDTTAMLKLLLTYIGYISYECFNNLVKSRDCAVTNMFLAYHPKHMVTDLTNNSNGKPLLLAITADSTEMVEFLCKNYAKLYYGQAKPLQMIVQSGNKKLKDIAIKAVWTDVSYMDMITEWMLLARQFDTIHKISNTSVGTESSIAPVSSIKDQILSLLINNISTRTNSAEPRLNTSGVDRTDRCSRTFGTDRTVPNNTSVLRTNKPNWSNFYMTMIMTIMNALPHSWEIWKWYMSHLVLLRDKTDSKSVTTFTSCKTFLQSSCLYMSIVENNFSVFCHLLSLNMKHPGSFTGHPKQVGNPPANLSTCRSESSLILGNRLDDFDTNHQPRFLSINTKYLTMALHHAILHQRHAMIHILISNGAIVPSKVGDEWELLPCIPESYVTIFPELQVKAGLVK